MHLQLEFVFIVTLLVFMYVQTSKLCKHASRKCWKFPREGQVLSNSVVVFLHSASQPQQKKKQAEITPIGMIRIQHHRSVALANGGAG